MKKFEFTGETKIWFGHTLHRIRAIKKIKLDMFTTVKPGDLGGWLEKESNLSQDGNAWVSDDARVYGNAWVSDDARVYGNAWVSDDARVSDDAVVKKREHYLTIGPIGSRNATTTFFRNMKGEIKVVCGCFHGSISMFIEKVAETHGTGKYAQVYHAAVELAKLQIENDPIEEMDIPTNQSHAEDGQPCFSENQERKQNGTKK